MASVLRAIAGDTTTILRATCKDALDKTVISLLGVTPTLHWKIDDATKVSKTMTVNSPDTAGIAQYQFLAGELVAGFMEAEIQLTDGAGLINTSFKFNINIEPRLV